MRLRYFVALAGVLAVVAAVLWTIPAGDFIFTPDRAKPLEGRVRVEGAQAGRERRRLLRGRLRAAHDAPRADPPLHSTRRRGGDPRAVGLAAGDVRGRAGPPERGADAAVGDHRIGRRSQCSRLRRPSDSSRRARDGRRLGRSGGGKNRGRRCHHRRGRRAREDTRRAASRDRHPAAGRRTCACRCDATGRSSISS